MHDGHSAPAQPVADAQKKPGLHGRHAVEPGALDCPTPHAWHAVTDAAPVAVENVAPGHGAHEPSAEMPPPYWFVP